MAQEAHWQMIKSAGVVGALTTLIKASAAASLSARPWRNLVISPPLRQLKPQAWLQLLILLKTWEKLELDAARAEIRSDWLSGVAA